VIRRRARTCIAACALLAVVSCARSEPELAPGSTPTASGATGTAVQASPPPLENEEYFAVVDDVDTSANTISFDLASFVEGKRAKDVAREEGAIGEDEELDTDYFIRNKVEFVRTVGLADDVKVRVVGDPPDLVDGTIEDFAAAFDSEEGQPFADDGSASYRGAHGRYWLTIKKSEVAAIEEQYLP
jgi:hypothetical protein